MQDFAISVSFDDGEASPERLARLVAAVRQEVRQLDVAAVEFAQGTVPDGARGGAMDFTTLLVTLAASPVLVELVKMATAWIARAKDRSVELVGPCSTLRLTGAAAAGQEVLIREWLAANQPGAGAGLRSPDKPG